MAGPFEHVNLRKIQHYYDLNESRLGYRYLLGGTKHFGFYEPGLSMWRFSQAMRASEDRLAAELSLPPGSSVLDAGCGVGNVARAMAVRHGLDVTGIDILEFNLAEARRRSHAARLDGQTRFLSADYHHLDFPDASFDGLYTMETFVHSADPKAVLAGFYRVLKPGGRLVMFEYSRTPHDDLSDAANAALQRVCDEAAMPAWLQLDHGVLETLLGERGFTVERSLDTTAQMMPMLRAFRQLGTVPYWVGRVAGFDDKLVNAMSAVEMYAHQEAWRYNIYVAVK